MHFKETLKKIWAVRQKNRARIGLYHVVLSLTLFFFYYITKVDIYAVIIGLNVVYTLLCLWCLSKPKTGVQFWIRNKFIFWNIFTQSVVFIVAGLIEVGLNYFLLIPTLNVCLSFITMSKLAETSIEGPRGTLPYF